MTSLADEGNLDISGQRLEYRIIGPRPQEAATLVLLHDALGCLAMWGDFPDRLARETGAGVFVYSRAGHGRSSAAPAPPSIASLHDEALSGLPKLFDAIGFRRGLLVGHGEGASIGALYAGNVEDHRVRGLALIAPHFFAEECAVAAVAGAGEASAATDLRARLARHHADPDAVYRGWRDVRLDPAFRAFDIAEELAYIRVPVLIVQGETDPYGSMRQVEVAQEECYCPVEVALLPGVKHAPQEEAPDATLAAVAGFANRLLRDHHEGDLAAHAA